MTGLLIYISLMVPIMEAMGATGDELQGAYMFDSFLSIGVTFLIPYTVLYYGVRLIPAKSDSI